MSALADLLIRLGIAPGRVAQRGSAMMGGADVGSMYPFQNALDARAAGGLLAVARPALRRILSVIELDRLYSQAREITASRSFCQRVLDALGVHIDAHIDATGKDGLGRIPATGPLIIIANHPFGGLDGLVLLSLLGRVRSDVKLLANRMLACVPDLHDQILPVDVFNGTRATRQNAGTARAAMRWLRDGGALVIFPAGEVSALSIRAGSVTDAAWDPAFARLARATGATVVPFYFDGRNSTAFQVIGLIHPRLRTLLLPRELLARRHGTVAVVVGDPIPPSRLDDFGDARAMTDYLRARTYLLAGRLTRRQSGSSAIVGDPARHWEPVAPPNAPDRMAHEIAALPPGQILVESGTRTCCWATAGQIPTVLREIARLREIAFRDAGEGTGRAEDMDVFDEHYVQLFVWDREGHRIVGGYRLGLVDEVLRQRGADGLYTSTLFRYAPELLARLGPSIELGRSFVRVECQREFAPLLMLWKGIARFVEQRPHYRMLLGTVSISNTYSSLTRQLLIRFLRLNHGLPVLAALLTARNAPRLRRRIDGLELDALGTAARDVEDVDRLVQEIESDRRGMPVLLRQYLKLNARLLGFNVDPTFGDVLDALMLVDLATVPLPLLARYMGAEAAARYQAVHAAVPSPIDRVNH